MKSYTSPDAFQPDTRLNIFIEDCETSIGYAEKKPDGSWSPVCVTYPQKNLPPCPDPVVAVNYVLMVYQDRQANSKVYNQINLF